MGPTQGHTKETRQNPRPVLAASSRVPPSAASRPRCGVGGSCGADVPPRPTERGPPQHDANPQPQRVWGCGTLRTLVTFRSDFDTGDNRGGCHHFWTAPPLHELPGWWGDRRVHRDAAARPVWTVSPQSGGPWSWRRRKCPGQPRCGRGLGTPFTAPPRSRGAAAPPKRQSKWVQQPKGLPAEGHPCH